MGGSRRLYIHASIKTIRDICSNARGILLFGGKRTVLEIGNGGAARERT